MLSAPASIPLTTAAVFAAAFGEGTDSPSSRPYRPADSASRSAGTKPAADTRFGSSKTGRILWEGCTYEVLLLSGWKLTSQSTSSLLGRAFSFYATLTTLTAAGGSGFSQPSLLLKNRRSAASRCSSETDSTESTPTRSEPTLSTK